MPLTTRCRHCGRHFPVYAQQIKERRGRVNCPQCGKRFGAIGRLVDEAIPGFERQQDDRKQSGDHQLVATAHADMLDLNEGRVKVGRVRVAAWSLGVLLLITGLIIQIGWWDRGKWIQHPRMRAAVEAVCRRIDCALRLPRLSGTMEVQQPALTEREEAPGGLRLSLLLVNTSAVSQRLPQLQLELYDEKGDLEAARRFGPNEYLANTRYRRGLAPGGALRPMLDLVSPPTPAAGFRVKLF